MKSQLNFLLIMCALLLVQITTAQNVAINNSGNTADASAMLDISSNTKGVLIPRMATWERINIQTPAQGLLVYDTSSRSFWYYDGAWTEISGGGINNEPAGGDLYGTYPTPSVGKIQNLDVAFGVPFDKQILKWDALQNNWAGRNDSLFLPYNVTYTHNGNALFGITTNSSTGGSSAIHGKRGATGSGITPLTTMGVWGDNSNGLGVVGTSQSGVGTYGFSFQNNGVYGYSTEPGFAGIAGSHANNGGIGVLGEINQGGTAVKGLNTGNEGISGSFTSTNSEHTGNTFLASTEGKGPLSVFSITNAQNTHPGIDLINDGIGHALKVRHNAAAGSSNAIDILSEGSGIGMYSKSHNGIPGKFEINNASNSFPVMMLGNNGFGTSLFINSTHSGLTGPIVDVLNNGTGNGLNVTNSGNASAANFTISSATANKTNTTIQQNGTGRALYVNHNNANATLPAVDVVTQATKGITIVANADNAIALFAQGGGLADNAIGVKGTTAPNVQNGIGVLGQAGVNDPNGIGVKGIAGGDNDGGIGVLGETSENTPLAIAVKGVGYTHNEDVGAITGINMVDGVGVLGESLGFDGIGVAGIVGNTGNHSVAAMFRNNFVNNDRAVVEVVSNGKGNGVFIDNTNLTNNISQLRIRNSGTGNFFRFEDGLSDQKAILEKDGDFITDGAVTVRSNKGIVRNSTSTQLRTEIITVNVPALNIAKYDEFNYHEEIDITFSTPFASAPSVYIGNYVSGSLKGLTAAIYNVTTTGCLLDIGNYSPHSWETWATTMKIIVIGAE